MSDRVVGQIERLLRRAAALAPQLLTVGIRPDPQPPIDPDDLAGTARQLRYWVADLESHLDEAGVELPTHDGRATPRVPAEAAAQLEALAAEVAELRTSERQARTELAAARAKLATVTQALTTIIAADTPDSAVVPKPAPAGRPASTRRWLLDLLVGVRAEGGDGWMSRADIGAAAQVRGYSANSVSSALSRARAAGEVEHDRDVSAWRAASSGNVVALHR